MKRTPKMTFNNNQKKKGEVLRVEDWNGLHQQLAKDLDTVFESIQRIEGCGDLLICTGMTSHGLSVDLGWDVEPIVIPGQLVIVRDSRPPWTLDTPPFIEPSIEVTDPGKFTIHASSLDDAVWAAVRWTALGVVGR